MTMVLTHEISSFKYDGKGIPDYMQEGLLSYIEQHTEPGGFLRAILENDLLRACDRADHTNLWLLPVYVSYLYSCVPGGCWGSPEKVAKWLENKA